MDRRHEPRIPLFWMTLVAGLLVAPFFALAQQNAHPAVPSRGGAAETALNPRVGTPQSPLASTASGVTLTAGTALLSQTRISRILGSRVYNNRDEAIGEIGEVLLVPPASPAKPSPVAIIQVGGFLGMGGHLASVPLGDLRWNDGPGRISLSRATKEALRARPAFDDGILRKP